MDWEPITKTPPLTMIGGVMTNVDLLVWIDDPAQRMRGFARGSCTVFVDGHLHFSVDAFSGEWSITHWCLVTPPGTQVTKRWSQPGFAVVSDAGVAPIVHDFAVTKAEATHEAGEAARLPAHLRTNLRVVPAVLTLGGES